MTVLQTLADGVAEGPAFSLCYNGDDATLLCVGHQSGMVVIYDAENEYKCIGKHKVHSGWMYEVLFSQTLKLWFRWDEMGGMCE